MAEKGRTGWCAWDSGERSHRLCPGGNCPCVCHNGEEPWLLPRIHPLMRPPEPKREPKAQVKPRKRAPRKPKPK